MAPPPPVALDRPPAPGRAHRTGGGARPVDGDQLGAGMRERVEDHDGMPACASCRWCRRGGPGIVGDDVLAGAQDPGVGAGGVVVDPVDPRSGDDVVELVEEEELPQPLDLGGGVPGPAAPESTTAPHPAGRTRPGGSRAWWRLGWCRCPGAAPGRARPPTRRGRAISASAALKKARGPSMVSRGRPSESARRRADSSISAVGPPPPSPQPKRYSDRVARSWSLKFFDSEAELAHAHVAAVGVGRREVGEDPRAVDALPDEAVMGEDVVLVPRELLGEEPADAAAPHDLGQGGGVAEHVGKPHIVGLDPELVEVETLSVDDLSDE